MRCEHARDRLAEHALGTLDPAEDSSLRAHLRGCASCRGELDALAEGVGTFALASHDHEAPPELRERVRTVLAEEWAEPQRPAAPPRARWLPRLALATALVAAIAVAGFSSLRASRVEAEARRYEAFLEALGGESVRVGEFTAAGSNALEGSVVIYDSAVGQSWVLVLCRFPGWEGTAHVTLVAGNDRKIDLRPMEIGPAGEGSTWLVTSSDLRGFDRVNVWDEDGAIAAAEIDHA